MRCGESVVERGAFCDFSVSEPLDGARQAFVRRVSGLLWRRK